MKNYFLKVPTLFNFLPETSHNVQYPKHIFNPKRCKLTPKTKKKKHYIETNTFHGPLKI